MCTGDSLTQYRINHGLTRSHTEGRGTSVRVTHRTLLSPLPTCRTELPEDPVPAPKARAISIRAHLQPLESDVTQPPRARKEVTRPPEDTKGPLAQCSRGPLGNVVQTRKNPRRCSLTVPAAGGWKYRPLCPRSSPVSVSLTFQNDARSPNASQPRAWDSQGLNQVSH